MSQIAVRDLSPTVEAHIRERARIEGRSLSAVVSELLAEATGLGTGERRRDLSRFSGSWSAEDLAEFEATQGDFERIDPELWS
jgi:plasmid stability protein